MLITSGESAVFSNEQVEYIRNVENYFEKKKKNSKIIHDAAFDGLDESKNIEIYDAISNKLACNLFLKFPGNQANTLNDGKEKFINLDFDKQIQILINSISLIKSGRAGGVDLKDIGGSASSGVPVIGAKLSSIKNNYSEFKIVDMSPAGLHIKESINLLDLLK